MPRGGILKRGRSYMIIYYDGGKRKLRAVGPRKTKAEEALAQRSSTGKRATSS